MNSSKEQMEVDDAAIVQEVRAGNVDAFRVLVDRHSRALHRVAYRMTGNEHDAEDIVQESFMRAYRDLDRFEARASFATWLHRIGVNCALDLLRARKYRVSESEARDGEEQSRLDTLPARDPLPDQGVCNAEIRRRITAAFGLLSPSERAAFALRHVEHVPIVEIGRILGLRENATKSAIFRAVRKLRQTLSPLEGEL